MLYEIYFIKYYFFHCIHVNNFILSQLRSAPTTIEIRLGMSWFLFGVIWCLLVWFGVICIFFGGNQCSLMRFGCDLFLNDLVWYYWGQVRSELVCFWCGLVFYSVIWWFLHCLVLRDVFWRGLGVICFRMIWCDIIEVRLGLTWFVFGVVWCILVWFGVICIFFDGNQCFWCDLVVISFWMIWCDIIEVKLGLSWFLFCGLVSYGVVRCDFYIFWF